MNPGGAMLMMVATMFLLSPAGSARQANVAPQEVLARATVSPADRQLALAQLWREARDSFAYYDRVAATWDRLYQQFAPRVAAAATDHAYYLELMRFYAHLHDGHSGVFWPAAFDEALGYPPRDSSGERTSGDRQAAPADGRTDDARHPPRPWPLTASTIVPWASWWTTGGR
jgi:hypothetical protein